MASSRTVFHNFHDFYGVIDGSQLDVDVGYHLNASPYTLPTATGNRGTDPTVSD
jgi:hypothetical protein